MKIEIDLNDILHDEFGPEENLAQSVKRQVIDNLTARLTKDVTVKIDEEISLQISAAVTNGLKEKMPSLVDDLMSLKYTPIDNYGRTSKGPTTLRDELINALQSQMQYLPKNWDSDKNYFTKAVDEICKTSLQEWKVSFQKKVDEMFTKEALAHAVTSLQKKLGITA